MVSRPWRGAPALQALCHPVVNGYRDYDENDVERANFIAVNSVDDALRDALDPRLNG